MNSKLYILSKEEIEERRKILTLLLENAASIIEKYIKKFGTEPRNKLLIEDLSMGLSNIRGGVKLIREGDWLERVALKYPPGKRGGFGLSRGFGEFLYALPKEYESLVDEIMEAVRKIEHYFASM